jgi:hypothetical protein
VTLYEEAAVLITDLPLIGEYQLAKIMRNAICWYANLMQFTLPPSSAGWFAWDKMSNNQVETLANLRSLSGEALSSPSALVAFIREGGADLPPLAKGALKALLDALSDLDMGVLLCELVGWVIDMVKPNALISLDSLLQFLQHILHSDDKLSVFLRSGGVNAGVMQFFQAEEQSLKKSGLQSSLAEVLRHNALAENREALKANKCNFFPHCS